MFSTVRDPQYVTEDGKAIRVTVTFANWPPGTHQFIAHADDVEAHGVDLYNAIRAGVHGPVAPYVEALPEKYQLVSYAERLANQLLAEGIKVNIGSTAAPSYIEISGSAADRLQLNTWVLHAMNDPSFATVWTKDTSSANLTVANIIALSAAMLQKTSKINALLVGTKRGIEDGSITTKAQVESCLNK